MKKTTLMAFLLALLAPVMSAWAGSYYASLTTTVKSGSGKVYAAATQTAEANRVYASQSSGPVKSSSTSTSGGAVGSFYAYAKPDTGWKFVKWTDASGNTVSESEEYNIGELKASTTDKGTQPYTYYVYFEELKYTAFSITFQVSDAGSYTVDGTAPVNKTGLEKVTSVVLASSDSNFLSWTINGETESKNPHTVSCTSDTTIGANFLTADQVTTATTYEELTAALSNAQYVKITIPSGKEITVAKGATLTVPSDKQLVVDGTLWVEGTLAATGSVVANGKVSKCLKEITQTGDNGKPFNPYGSVKYWKTSSATSSASITGFTGFKTHALIVGGTGTEYRPEITSSSKLIIAVPDSTVAVNHIKSIGSVSTSVNVVNATLNSGMVILLGSDCVINGGLTAKEGFRGVVDCAGFSCKTITSQEVSGNNGKATFLNCPSFTGSKVINITHDYFNCNQVTLSSFNAGGSPILNFYDCGTFSSPASFSVGTFSKGPTDTTKFNFYSGYYNSLSYKTCYKVYGGSYTADPNNYIPASLKDDPTNPVSAVYDGSKYYVVQVVKPAEKVVSVGGVEYETLEEAVAKASNGATISLIGGVDLTGKTVEIPLGKNITIALDKHTITGGKIVNRGTLLITDITVANESNVKCDIENYGTLDLVFGTYTGAIANKAGTLTTHNGVFTGTLAKDGGTVNLKGGHFTADVTAFVTAEGYDVFKDADNRFCVCELPNGTMYDATVSGTAGYGATPYSDADFSVLQSRVKNGKTSRSEYSDANWKRLAELLGFYQVFSNKGLDATLVFDRDVAANGINLYAQSTASMPVDFKSNLPAGQLYRALSEVVVFTYGYYAKTYYSIFDESIKSVAMAVSDKSGNNKGTVCKAMVELWTDVRAPDYSSTGHKVTNTVYVVGQKLFTIDAGSNKAMIRPATGAATFYATLGAAMGAAADGGTVMLANDCGDDLELKKAGTYTFDTMGFAFTGEVKVGNGLKIVSQATVDSSAKLLVPEAVATTYEIGSSAVAKVGDDTYESLAAAVAKANGAVVTLVADSNETITLAAGQTLKLAVADGAAFGGSVVSGDATCHVDSSVADGVTTYTLRAIVAVLPPTGEVQGAAIPGETAPTAAEVASAVESLTGNTTISKVDSGVASVNAALTGDNQIKEVGVTPVSVTLETVDGVKVVKAATFDVKPVDMAGNAMTTLPEGKSLTFRLPVDAHARATKARVFHGEEQLDGLYAVATSGDEKYVELSAGSFSPYGYELLEITADMITVADTVYIGGSHEPAVTVKDGDTVLEAGTDYTVSYANNNAVGTGTVTVTGAGNYAGSSATKDFAITGAGYGGEVLPAAPVVDGNTITVTPANIQYTLDGAYGSIDGKTIVLSEGTYPKLYFARATKFPESGTEYYKKQGETKYTTIEDIQAHRTEWGTCHYNRTMQNVTFKPAEGAAVTVAGVECKSGHVYGPNQYDYLLDYGNGESDGSMYYLSQTVSGIKFDGLTFTDKVNFATSASGGEFDEWYTTIAGVTFDGCTFNGSGTASSVGAAIRYYSEAATGYVSGLTVTDCTFNNWYQGVYCNGVKDITVTKSGFDTTGHNAIAVQTQAAADAGAIAITDNTFKNIGDRVIRFGSFATGTEITITGNTAMNSGDSDGEVIKATGVADGIPVTMASNTWDQGAKSGSPEFGAAGIGTTYYMSLTDAIAAANSQNVDEITILNGATESPDAAWKVADGKLVRKTYVAKIGETKYETIDDLLVGLQTAIVGGSYANTITFLADVELADNFVIPQEMAQFPTTFDLNGKHITLATGKTHAIRNNGQLTLVDSAGGGSVTAPIPVINESGATFNMQGGTLICNEQGRNAVQNRGTFNMTGGSLQVSYVGSSSDSFGSACLSNSGTATITKGSLTSVNQRAYAIINSGTLTINPAADSDVAVTGAHGAVAVDGGTVSISGGSYTATNYYALYVSNEASDPTVTVTGGTFDGNAYSAYIGSDVNESVTASVAISGGTFNDPIIENDKVADGSGFAISGGNFTTAVAEDYCATGYIPAAQDSETSMYTVKQGAYVAQVVREGAVVAKYETLVDAVAAANDGDTIEMLADDNVSLTGGARLTIDKSLTITGPVDTNGEPLYTIYGTPAQTGTNNIYIDGDGTVTLSNLKIKDFGNNKGTDGSHAPVYVASSFTGTVNLDKLYISDFNRGGVFLYGGTFNVTDCYIDCANSRSGAFTKGIEIKGTATGTIADTVICNMERSSTTYSTAGIEVYGNGTITVDGCTILSDVDPHQSVKGTYGIVSSRVGEHDPSGGSLHVTDCWIDVSNAALSVADDDEYGPVNNYSIVVDGEDTYFSNYIATWSAGSSITVAEGEFNEDVYADAGTINITGGTFNNFLPDTGTGTISISGGIFDKEVSEEYCAEGYIPAVYDEDTGLYTVKQGAYVAQIGETKYETLADAFAAANAAGTATIEMIADYELVGNVGVTVNASSDITLDLNGHTLSQVGPMSGAGYFIRNNGTLTLKDSTDTQKDGTGTGMMTTSSANPDTGAIPSYANNLINNYGTLTIESGSYKSLTNAGHASFVVDNYSGGTANITGGKLTNVAPKAYVVRMFLNSTTANNALNISGGIIEGTYAVWMQYPNNNANKGSLNVSGGTIKATDGYAVYAGGDGTRDASNIEVSFTGGTVGGTGVWLGSDTAFKSLSVSGGNYEAFGASAMNEKFISGGTFASTDLFSAGGRTDYKTVFADGYVKGDNADPETMSAYPYTVIPAVASVTAGEEGSEKTTYFATFAEAIAAANEAGVDEITVLNGATESPDTDWQISGDKLVRKVYVAQIVRGGEVIAKYEAFDAALTDALSGDTVQLLADVTGVTTTYNIDKAVTIDGQGQYKIVAGENPDPRSVVDAWSGSRVMFDMTRSTANVTFKDITIDNGEGHYYSFLARVKSGTTTFEDAAILHGAEADASGADGVGYGAAVQVDGGIVLVTGNFYADTHGAPLGDNETGDRAAGIFPFTAFLYQDGGIHFDDNVNVSIGQDLLLVGMVGALDVANDQDRQKVQEMLDQMNVPAGYNPYTLKLGDSSMTSFTGASPLGWNDIIDYGKEIMTTTSALGMEMNPATTPVEVGLLEDTVLPDTFVFEDSNFTVDGNGYALSGTIEYTDTAGLIHDIVMGTDDNALVLDMTGVTQPIRIGSGIVVGNVTVKMTPEQATAGTPVIIWDAAHGVDAPENEAGVTVQIVDDQGDSTGVTKELIWDDEMGMAYIGPCEARLTGPTHDKPIYTSLANAIALAAQSGDTVTLLMNVTNVTTTYEISKQDLVIDGAGYTVAAAPVTEHRNMFEAWSGSKNMFKLQTGNITFRNITLDGDETHAYTFLISGDNSSVALTTENVRLIHGGEISEDSNNATVTPGNGYGAAIHLNNGAHLIVSNGFYACTGTNVNGVTTGVFPFTAILPENLEAGTSVAFELTGNPNDPANVDIGDDLLLVGMIGDLIEQKGIDAFQGILNYMKVPSRFIPYTLTLADGSAYAFTGASPRRWNEIIDYGKDIMDVATANGFSGLDKDTTPVEVGLATDTVLPAGADGDGYDFLYEDSNFSINGNGNALSGTIKFTDDAKGGLMHDIDLGTDDAPLTLDLSATTNAVMLGGDVVISNVVVKLTEDQATLGKVVFEWDSGETPPDDEQGVEVTVVNNSGTPTGETKGLIWDEEYGVAYIGPCEARLTGATHETPVYTSLANALDIAKDNDKVELLTNAVLSAAQGVGSDVTLDLAGYKVSVNGAKGLLVTNATLVIADTSVKTNGTICAGDEASPASLIESGNGGVVNIPTGIFVAASGQNVLVTSDNGAIAVSGGYFSKQVLSEHCAESYMPVDAEAGAPQPYTVAEFVNEFRYPIDGSVGVPVERTWLAQNFSDIYSDSTKPVLANVTNALVEALSKNGANEMPRWESYVLGLDPTDVTARLRLTATSKDAATVTIIGLIDMTKFPKPEGTTITFRLAEVNPDGTKKADIVTDSEEPLFDVLLEEVVGKELAIFADIAVEAVAK